MKRSREDCSNDNSSMESQDKSLHSGLNWEPYGDSSTFGKESFNESRDSGLNWSNSNSLSESSLLLNNDELARVSEESFHDQMHPNSVSQSHEVSLVPNDFQPLDGVAQTLTESPKKSRRRKKYVENWRRNIQKKRRNSGLPYMSSRGQLMPERKIGPMCRPACKLQCAQKVTEQQRAEIFQTFWDSGDLMVQRNFISKCLETCPVLETKRKKKDRAKARKVSNKFFLPIEEVPVRVCKVMFVNTLGISNRRISTVNKKLKNGFLDGDKRGQHGNQKRLDVEIKSSVIEFINKIPRIESHYCRADTSREFIENSKSVADIHRDYKDLRMKEGKPFASYKTFNNIFNNEFNLSFFQRKKDLCNLCESYKNSTEGEKMLIQNSVDIHHREKILIREMKARDKQNEAIVTACFDLEAVLSCPVSDVNAFYYVSKIATYNFTIFELQSTQGYCYVWNESEGGRGPNEIGTCLWRYLRRIQCGKPVVLYADNCSGQNKNKYVTSLLMHAVQVLDIPSISLHFFVVGHSQNENDTMHSLVEKQKKRALAAGPIYVPAQWIPVIAAAKKSGRPFKIDELDYSDFIDVKHVTTQIGKNFNKTQNKEKVLWTEIRSMMFLKGELNSFSVKETFEEQGQYKKIVVAKHVNHSDIDIKPLFSKPIGVGVAKLSGLLDLCKKNLILKKYHYFYENLKAMEQEQLNDTTKRKKNNNRANPVKRRRTNFGFVEEDFE